MAILRCKCGSFCRVPDNHSKSLPEMAEFAKFMYVYTLDYELEWLCTLCMIRAKTAALCLKSLTGKANITLGQFIR